MTRILKFGGQSLANGIGLQAALTHITKHYRESLPTAPRLPLVVVVSARGNATSELLALAEKAQKGLPYRTALDAFKATQAAPASAPLAPHFERLEQLLQGVQLLGEVTPQTSDAIAALGECLSAATIVSLLQAQGLPAHYIDGGACLLTDSHFTEAKVLRDASRQRTQALFATLPDGTLPIVTGFIACDAEGRRTTLGRNASNYTAALLANFLQAEKLYNYTHVDGVYTADPIRVPTAKKIDELSYTEAAELSQFGAKVIHYLTMEPLQEQGIPFHILNTFSASSGTLITARPKDRSVRALASVSGKALIHFEGRDMLGRVGIDARIFTAFARHHISVSLVSQGSSERGIALVVEDTVADQAVEVLRKAFSEDLSEGATTAIYAEKGLAVVALIGVNLSHFDRPYKALVRNGIIPILLNNAVPGNTVCLLLHESEVTKALNVIHNELFDAARKVHIAVLGHGKVGSAFIDQLTSQRELLRQRQGLDLRLFAIADSKRLLLKATGLGEDWATQIAAQPACTSPAIDQIIAFARHHRLENLVCIDNTASAEVPAHYDRLVRAGFDLVSSNKIGNTGSYADYLSLRHTLKQCRKTYRYETNVGAGLPLIDNLRLLHLSGDRITRIRGLFSGSLSYLFHQLSRPDGAHNDFATVLQQSIAAGYTEPDPRIDLSGLDVARKVLILARELDLPCELEEVQVESLVPPALRHLSLTAFEQQIGVLATHFQTLTNTPPHTVVRFVGELIVGQPGERPQLYARPQQLPADLPLARATGADSCFEIYTENYGALPIVIQGAGAGAAVTAQGVFADLLRTVENADT